MVGWFLLFEWVNCDWWCMLLNCHPITTKPLNCYRWPRSIDRITINLCLAYLFFIFYYCFVHLLLLYFRSWHKSLLVVFALLLVDYCIDCVGLKVQYSTFLLDRFLCKTSISSWDVKRFIFSWISSLLERMVVMNRIQVKLWALLHYQCFNNR